jgi:hypothetical protein
MPLELPVKPRVRLPDALPEFDLPSAPRRSRKTIFAVSFALYAAVLALAIGLTYGALPLLAPAATTAPAPEQSSEPATRAAPPPERPETAQTKDAPAAPAPAPTNAPEPVLSGPLPTCEQAADTYKDDLSEGTSALPRDMTGSAYGALLDGPATAQLLNRCAAHSWRHVDLCVAVRGFRAVGVTAETDPEDGSVERCVARTLAGLSFSHQPVLRVIRTEISLPPEHR